MVECSECGRVSKDIVETSYFFIEHDNGEWYCEHCYDFITKDEKCGCEPVANFGIIMTALHSIKDEMRDMRRIMQRYEEDQEHNNTHLANWLETHAKIVYKYLKTVDDHMSLFRSDYLIPKLKEEE